MADVCVEHMLRIFGFHSKRAAEEALAPLGMRPQEYDVMEIISRYMADPDVTELTPDLIAKRMGVMRTTVYNYIGNARRSGYIRETAGGGSLLTAKGEEMLTECRRALRHSERRLAGLFQPHVLEGIIDAFLDHEEQEGGTHY